VATDAEEFTALSRLSTRFHRGLISPPADPEQYTAYLERCQRGDFEGMLICRREDEVILGAVNLSQIFRGNFQSAYMGYQIGAPFARHGYMTEALHLALRHAFGPMKLHRIEANIQPSNTASIALVKHVGFTLEGFSRRYLKIGGRWRDHERWAILAEDWRATQRPRGS
jgi:ribosomal-protein-alanine N-acetyltransferase